MKLCKSTGEKSSFKYKYGTLYLYLLHTSPFSFNLRKTQILVFGINMGLSIKSGMDPCSVLQTGEDSNAIFNNRLC